MTYIKKSHTKLYLAILLIAIISVATGAVLYSTLSTKQVKVGVNVGDTFTYSIKGIVTLTGLDATMSPGFGIFNETDYYKVSITGVNNTQVSMDVAWKFLNGTEIVTPQTIDIATGNKTTESGFWAIYPADLNIADLLRPNGFDGTIVNNTYPAEYSSGERSACFWRIDNEFYNYEDPTRSTLMYDYRAIDFDRATGMLTSLSWYQFFNNPEKTEQIVYKLVDTSVWQI